MAKYDVTHTCGHTQVVQLFGKHTERDRKIEWLSGQDCPDCRAAAFNASNAAQADAIRATAYGAAWPKLEGTEKQVAWAETVRFRLLPAAEEWLIRCEAQVAEARQAGQVERADAAELKMFPLGMALDRLRSLTSARFWIDNRTRDPRSLLEEGVEFLREEEEEKEKSAKEAATATKVRDWAVRARSIFGSDQPEFTVSTWERDGDRRVYVGHGYDSNWVEYYHTGNGRTAPGTLKVIQDSVVSDLSAHLGVTRDEARDVIKEYCRQICQAWKALKLEVNPGNAQLAEGTLVTKYLLRKKDSKQYGADGPQNWWTYHEDKADSFATAELAMAAAPRYCGERGSYLAKSLDEIEVVPYRYRLSFPPRGA